VTRFCAGLRESGGRALSEEERVRATAFRRRLARATVLRALQGAAIVPAAAVASARLGDSFGPEVALGALVVTAFVAAGAALAVRDALRDRRRLGRDLRDPAPVLVFAAGTRSLDVLARSGRLVARDGAAADLRERVAVGAAAPPPRDAPTYAVSADVATGALALGLVRRALSADECAELRGHAARLARIPASLVLATAAGGAAVGVWIASPERGGDGSGALWMGVVALSWWRAFAARRLAARLREDVGDGWVLRATAGDLAGTELLPASRASWTARGVPAAWRLQARRR
jgi:hypothetical protein